MIRKMLCAAAAAAVLGMAVSTPAEATTLYPGMNYQGRGYYSIESKAFAKWFNDKASSIDSSRMQTFYEHTNWSGRSSTISRSYSDLRDINYNLSWAENWNDRISSVKRGRG
ncbi:MAG: hypothetical protein E7L00_04460 [Propionibacteriaceae bacterium]|nr:hypothetical protein [Propionibacteriaceae bacterium]